MLTGERPGARRCAAGGPCARRRPAPCRSARAPCGSCSSTARPFRRGSRRRELCVETIHVDHGDLLKLQMTERGIDVDADKPPVPSDGRRSSSGDRQRREPIVEVRLERDPTRAHVRAVLEIGERVVEGGLRVLLRAEAALTNLLAPAVARPMSSTKPHVLPLRLMLPVRLTRGVLRSRCRESAGARSADVCARENESSADVCAEGLCKRLRGRRWSPFGHGDHEYRRKTANGGERRSARKPLLSRV